MKPTFATCFLKIYGEEKQSRVLWRIRRFQEIAETGIQLCLFVDPKYVGFLTDTLIKYPNVVVLRVLTLQETRVYNAWTTDNVRGSNELPRNRKAKKDTIEYLCLMNAKTEFLRETVLTNPFGSNHFGWIDFNVSHVFLKKARTLSFLRFLGNCSLTRRFLAIPGCWGNGEVSLDSVCWRFCGGFLLGDRESILAFEESSWNCIIESLPTWEVNVWAMAEKRKNSANTLTVDWYCADHNDSMICNLLAKWFSVDLNTLDMEVAWKNVEYPMVPFYQPSSVSHCLYQGQDVVNVRYVSYYLTPEGQYFFPDGSCIIKNINMVSYLSPTHEGLLSPTHGFTWVKEKNIGLSEKAGFSQGVEDIRLFEDHDGQLRFIGTTVGYSQNGTNQMMIGDYNEGELKNGQIVEGIQGNVCEKNWIPLPDGEHYIYSWHPYRVGKIVDAKMVIVDESILMLPLFEKVRGSSVFLPTGGGEEYVGIVHFSENESPRHYFHMLVVLDKQFRWLRNSQPFHFYSGEGGIEFCTGFCIKNEKYCFWVSHFDRDPLLFVLSNPTIDSLFIK